MLVCCDCDVLCDGAWFAFVCFVCGVSFNVLVCGVGGLLFDVVWFAVVCDCCVCAVLFNVWV